MYVGHSWISLVVVAVGFVVRYSMMNRRGRRHPGGRSPARGLTDRDPSRAGPPPGTRPDPPDGVARSDATPGGTPPGWFRDPFVRHHERYWSGSAWTEHVTDDGTPSTDPPPAPRTPTRPPPH